MSELPDYIEHAEGSPACTLSERAQRQLRTMLDMPLELARETGLIAPEDMRQYQRDIGAVEVYDNFMRLAPSKTYGVTTDFERELIEKREEALKFIDGILGTG